jgi:glycosyltransferase involved in cell wall biosynthesis
VTPIRIARIITRLDLSGPARHVCALTAGLNDRKFQSWLMCGRARQSERHASEIAAESGIEPIYIDHLRRGPGPWDIGAALRISRELASIRPHIIATHTAKAGALGRTVALLRFGRGARRPRMVHTFHGHVFRGYFSQPVTRAFIAIERQLARSTDAIVTVSPAVRRELVDEYRIAPPEKVRVVPLGFDFSWVQELERHRGWLRARLGALESTVLFGTVGRLAKIKNTALVLRSFARMLRTEDIDARLVVIGDGECSDDLRSLARELAIEDRTLFCGWMLDRAKVFSDLDVTCLSSFNEGTPVCLIESLAAGVPVVATRVGGVADVVAEGHDGELVDSENKEGFAAAMAKVGRTRNRISHDRSAGIKAYYSSSRLITDIKTLYEEVLGDDRPSRALSTALEA